MDAANKILFQRFYCRNSDDESFHIFAGKSGNNFVLLMLLAKKKSDILPVRVLSIHNYLFWFYECEF